MKYYKDIFRAILLILFSLFIIGCSFILCEIFAPIAFFIGQFLSMVILVGFALWCAAKFFNGEKQ